MIETSFSTYSGGQFLLFYVLLFGLAFVASLFVAGRMRPEGRRSDIDDDLELAFLAGGPRRVTEATLAGLIARDAIKATAERKLWVAERGEGANGPERSVLSLTGDFGLKAAFNAVKPHAEAIEGRLVSKGILLSAPQRSSLRFYAAAPFLLLLCVGAWRLFAGLADGQPVGLLLFAMGATLVAMVIRMATISPHTAEGDEALERRRDVEVRLRTAPQYHEMRTGVALFGTAVLVGTPISGLHDMRQAAGANGAGGYVGDGGDDGSSDGGSGGDSGCGGGCGGCGG